MNAADIKDIVAEATVIASILKKPELTFFSESLLPNHFSNPENAYIYYAVSELARRNVTKVDPLNILNVLNMKSSTSVLSTLSPTKNITVESLQELFDTASLIARDSPDDYRVFVSSVLDAAFRRDTFNKLVDCERLCFSNSEKDIQQRIYDALDGVMMSFSSANDIPQYKDVVDQMWSEIVARQGKDGTAGIPFKWQHLNDYCTIEPGELVIVGAEAKQGKSMFLLNCAADLLKHNHKVLYIDSELNTRLFTCRMISHLTGIEFSRVKNGRYTPEEEQRINKAIAWLKTTSFTHIYLPIFDAQAIYTATKRVLHTQGLEVLIIDYFKSTGDGDAYATYQEMGRIVDRFMFTLNLLNCWKVLRAAPPQRSTNVQT